MNRHYTVSDYARIAELARKLMPELSLFTDIIVGFPGETEEQFENTRRAMEVFQFNMAFIARYSPRPGAVSARWEDDVSYETKSYRLTVLTEELRNSATAHNRASEDRIIPVLTTGRSRDGRYHAGLTEGKINVRFASEEEDLSGHFVDVRITGGGGISLEGEYLSVY